MKLKKTLSQDGFSLIDVVVTVAIVVALSVGGFMAYNGLVSNAKQGAVDYAASNVYKSALAYESDGRDNTSACTAVDEYNESSDGIDVELIVPVNPSDPDSAVQIYYGPNHGLYPNGANAPAHTPYVCS